MGIYPRQDCAIRVCLVDNSQLEGLVNIVGRDIKAFLLDSEANIVMYEAVSGEDERRRPMIVRKSQILWVEIQGYDGDDSKIPCLRNMKMKLSNGQVITGGIDITGYDRISDYYQKNADLFTEVYDATLDGEAGPGAMFVSACRYLWVIPDNND